VSKSTKKEFPEMYELGKKLVKLGKAMQKNNTHIEELSSMAFDCGLQLQFRLAKQVRTPADSNKGE
jgi:hypothetical protein